MSFRRSSRTAARVDVVQQSRRRGIPRRGRLVARFRNRLAGFTWNGRANVRGRRVRDGVYVVRFHGRSAAGKADVRRFTLTRRRGRWFSTRGHVRNRTCGLLRSAALTRPVFGGRQRRGLILSLRLARSARVSVRVMRGSSVVRRFAARTRRSGVTHRLRLRARGTRRGAHRFRIVAVAGDRRVRTTLVARRL